MPIEWSLARQPDFGGNALAAFQDGQDRRQQMERNALATRQAIAQEDQATRDRHRTRTTNAFVGALGIPEAERRQALASEVQTWDDVSPDEMHRLLQMIGDPTVSWDNAHLGSRIRMLGGTPPPLNRNEVGGDLIFSDDYGNEVRRINGPDRPVFRPEGVYMPPSRTPAQQPPQAPPAAIAAEPTGPAPREDAGVPAAPTGQQTPVSFQRPVNLAPGSGYGPRPRPMPGASTNHQGIDYPGPAGTVVQAAADGVVVDPGGLRGLGNVVVVRHADGTETVYGHLQGIDVPVGTQVSAGQQIGTLGSTGTATGNNLHFGVRRNGQWVDPSTVVTGQAQATPAAPPPPQQGQQAPQQESVPVGGGWTFQPIETPAARQARENAERSQRNEEERLRLARNADARAERDRPVTMRRATPEEERLYGGPGQMDSRGEFHPLNTGQMSPSQRATASRGLRRQFDQDQSVRDFTNVADNYDVVTRLAGSPPTAANDISLVFAYMKMLDPGSVVREGEFATAQNAAGVPDRVRNAYNRAINGQILNPNQRQEFAGAARTVYDARRQRYDAVVTQYQGYAAEDGLPENTITPRARPTSPQRQRRNYTEAQRRYLQRPSGERGSMTNPFMIDPNNEAASLASVPAGAHYVTPDGRLKVRGQAQGRAR